MSSTSPFRDDVLARAHAQPYTYGEFDDVYAETYEQDPELWEEPPEPTELSPGFNGSETAYSLESSSAWSAEAAASLSRPTGEPAYEDFEAEDLEDEQTAPALGHLASTEGALETFEEDEEYIDLPWRTELEEPHDAKLEVFEAESGDDERVVVTISGALQRGMYELQRVSKEAALETFEENEEYLDLPWQPELEEPHDGKLGLFEVEDLDEGMARVARLRPYSQVGGIAYTPAERKFAAQAPKGLVRTSTVVGVNESYLQRSRPAPIEVGRELDAFDGGKLGVFVHTYNGFVVLMNEALHGLGHVQDLFKAGAPITPDHMTPTQKRRMLPTSDFKPTLDRKHHLEDWLEHKKEYEHAVGVAATTPRKLADARRTYWARLDVLREKILERRKLTKDAKELKKLEIVEIGLKDLIPIASSLAVSPTPLSVGVAVVSSVAEKALDAVEGRQKFDEKLARMKLAIESLNLGSGAALEELAVAVRAMYDARPALELPQQLRVAKRKKAAIFGQSLATETERRGRVAAEIRMPAMMADAQAEIATAAPLGRTQLRKALAFKPTVEKALNRYQLELRGAAEDRGKPLEAKRFYYHDITKIKYAYGELQKWTDEILEVIDTQSRNANKPWSEFFARMDQ